MTRIRVLSDRIVNRIAAGEVVERPASVVKELVENSLDADAQRVSVEVRSGGRTLIRVSDDGCGMGGDDLLLALERHATSKVSAAEDLDRISTLGFRGEAIPSIAAVSRFTLSSSCDPAEGGARVTVEGGRVLGVEGEARSRGTTVEVRDLFFNVPARRKFLHAPETELRHVQEIVIAMALARPEVAFELRHGSRLLLEVPSAADPVQRFRDLDRRRSAGAVYRAAERAGSVEVEALLSPGGGSGRPVLTLLANGRAVRDRILVGAAMRVLRESGPGLGGARVVLFVTLPPEDLDVNVHPAKAEVRFARPGQVFGAVERALRQAVVASHGKVAVRRIERAAAPVGFPPSAPTSAVQKPGEASLFPHPVYTEPVAGDGVAAEPSEVERGRSGARAGPADTPFGRLIGQYRSSFLLLEDEQGLVIVDQHVAHERVLYDAIRRQLAGAVAPAQRLLTPILLQVGEPLAGALERVASLLVRVGVEADRFAADTVRVSALPTGLDPQAGEDLVRHLLERATDLDAVPERVTEVLEEELAASLSCRAAIKINHPLAPEKQRALLADLASTADPYRCPHGRPIVLRLSQAEMERRLGRR